MIGGLVAAIGFEITRRGFAFSINLGGGYRAIYGALAAIPIFLIWVYLFWLITLLGAAVAAALPVVRYERWWHRAAPGSAFLDAMAIIKVLIDARAGHAAVDALKIRELTHLGFEESEALLQRMLRDALEARQDEPEAGAEHGHCAEGGHAVSLLLRHGSARVTSGSAGSAQTRGGGAVLARSTRRTAVTRASRR